MKLKEVIEILDEIAPFALQEDYDNSGIQLGEMESEVSSTLLALDCTMEVVDEAIAKSCNLIIAHHPLIFSGLKKIANSNTIERIIRKAIKNDISIVAIHTNLDNVSHGVNKEIADVLGIKNPKVLSPKSGFLSKLIFYTPPSDSKKILDALFEVGAGRIGEYSECSFSSEGYGTFKPSADAKPTLGEQGKLQREKEERIELILPTYLESVVLNKLFEIHPYEVVAYDLVPLRNKHQEVGSGMIGYLEKEIRFSEFLDKVKIAFNVNGARHTKFTENKVSKVAFCGGSGSFLLHNAIAQGADVFISGDFKYHQFFEAEDKITILDIGHYESEQYTPRLIEALLKEKIPNFVTHLSSINTNPIIYS